MDINQGNRLIADFMGAKKGNGGTKKYPVFTNFIIATHKTGWTASIKDAMYHTSWDWLMPVCKKFDHLPLLGMVYQKHCDNIDHSVTTYEILPVWNALTEAIQWYNNTQTPQP